MELADNTSSSLGELHSFLDEDQEDVDAEDLNLLEKRAVGGA